MDDDNPLGRPGSMPAADCSRCGVLCETPTEIVGLFASKPVAGFLCVDCVSLQYNDPRKYWDEGWAKFKTGDAT